MVFKSLDRDTSDPEAAKLWYVIATAALFELGKEFYLNKDILQAIMEGDIQLYQRNSTSGGLPSFTATVKGDLDFMNYRRGGEAIINGH